MPTRYRRVGVVLDPELSDALRLAGSRLRATSQAAQVRELALIGARSIGARDVRLDEVRRALEKLGATPARGDLLAISRRLRARGIGRRDETASESLEWVRGPR